MKASKIPLLIFLTLTATFTVAQQGPFKHIIIVVQENRTPDNLFGALPAQANCSQESPFETGVDIVDGGNVAVAGQNGYQDVLICNTPLPLNGWDAALNGGKGAMVDPDHGHGGWRTDYTTQLANDNTGYMDGFCHTWDGWSYPTCPPYSYVPKSEVQPYFDIATNYGFANYMFQSNQGPSMPAHQFLFTGTSAPVAPSSACSSGNNNQFLCRDDYVPNNDNSYPVGCKDTDGHPAWVQPDGTTWQDETGIGECYAHDSLVTDYKHCSNGGPDYCDRGIATWAYYVEPRKNTDSPSPGYSIWDAPAMIPEVCYGQDSQWGSGNPCGTGPSGNSKEWSDHVRIPKAGIYSNSYAPIFDDIMACNLPAINWVIPDGSYSDHPDPLNYNSGPNTVAIGPSWVGDIVDAIGQSAQNSNNLCDYWGKSTTAQRVEPTAIFVVWDDWGGWYDHVQPLQQLVRIDQNPPPTGYTVCDPTKDQWGCGYTDGFRVPLLVVSEYTNSGNVSGKCGAGTQYTCPNFGTLGSPYLYVHDFGSILKYTEVNFGMPPIDDYDSWEYADLNAPDSQNGNVPLSDFFPLPIGQGRSFTRIDTPYLYTCLTKPRYGRRMSLGEWLGRH